MSQVAREIVRELHDEPHLEGRRLTVAFLRGKVEERGLEPRTVADRHDLDVADVYRALTYYHDNPGEMREVERAREAAIDANRDRTTDPDPPGLMGFRLLADENVEQATVHRLRKLGHDVQTVGEVDHLGYGPSDSAIVRFASSCGSSRSHTGR